jgi:hypothetical protein
VAAVVNAVAPGLTASVLAAVDRLLPGPDGGSRPSPSWLTRLGDRAAKKYNQIA